MEVGGSDGVGVAVEREVSGMQVLCHQSDNHGGDVRA